MTFAPTTSLYRLQRFNHAYSRVLRVWNNANRRHDINLSNMAADTLTRIERIISKLR